MHVMASITLEHPRCLQDPKTLKIPRLRDSVYSRLRDHRLQIRNEVPLDAPSAYSAPTNHSAIPAGAAGPLNFRAAVAPFLFPRFSPSLRAVHVLRPRSTNKNARCIDL